MTIDGFISGLNGEMDWMVWDWDQELKKYVIAITETVDCIILGRKLAQGFIPHWASNPEQEGATIMNGTNKIVFTKTLDQSEWENTVLAKGDLAYEINKLKNEDGKDIIATRRACEKFRGMPVSIMNFVEGTRFTPAKRARQDSPYQQLLRPKAGGVAFVLDAMGSALHSVVDVTLAYASGTPTMLDLVSGRISQVTVAIREREIPAELLHSDYEKDSGSRVRFQRWINSIWADKDQLLMQMKGSPAP